MPRLPASNLWEMWCEQATPKWEVFCAEPTGVGVPDMQQPQERLALTSALRRLCIAQRRTKVALDMVDNDLKGPEQGLQANIA